MLLGQARGFEVVEQSLQKVIILDYKHLPQLGQSRLWVRNFQLHDFPLRVILAAEAHVGCYQEKSRGPRGCIALQRLFEKSGEIELAHSRNHLAFRSADRLVYTRLIEGPYPNYQQVIPTDNDRVATANRDNLASAIRRMAVVASDQTHRVRMSFSKNKLSFRVQTPDLGEAEEEMAIDYQGDTLEIGFNANYLLEILKYMPDEDVILQFKAPERAATFMPASGAPDYLCLVMPLRLLD